MGRGNAASQAPLPLIAPPLEPTFPDTLRTCAYWGEEACGRDATYTIYSDREPVPTCDMHIGQLTGGLLYRAGRENRRVSEIWIKAVPD